ncbi:enoyl-CoA hydratase/isomerase family protein [Dehalogenimonas alkenigignens]|uniref:Enoyl-CoA hydratase/carnithine racemase n=1 Tax=Dehalogenimonas alkenigignens TaxID=1217799 RepID=A0A0W0GHG0_9CHLR|nr:enoyl-CoA hydratase/isomerase family protein [Dehalogenimonas alkenigignens]KTB47998.1 Enoyl-CoA hydratase/carnithine racemase [Dehalogenimonas alkenigignens]PVV84257.1 enoyl-CoA hydratase/isomerase family protein [Dehalogenimonas alkenigignens]
MTIDFTTDGAVALITLNRPEAYNALDLASLRALSDAVAHFETDPSLRVAVITGTGKAFCAGADIGETLPCMKENGTKSLPPTIMRGQTCSKPLIAAINGLALGGGLELALACDIRVAGSSARLGLPEIGLGLIPGWGGTQRLPRLVGGGRAAEMILTGRAIDAAEAERIGLVNKVVPDRELMAAALEMAGVIAEKSPDAVRFARETMYKGFDLPLGEALDLEAALEDAALHTPGFDESLRAYREKRRAHKNKS